MNNVTTVIANFAATDTNSPLFAGAVLLTFVGIGMIIASFVSANRQSKVKR